MAGPQFSEAMVLSADPKSHGVRVVLASGQSPAWPVRVLHKGSADGMTVSHHALPRPGSWGLVAFPGGDNRSGVWLGALNLCGVDAYSTETDANLALDSHWSGNFEQTTGDGEWTHSFSDGSFIQVASSTTKPVLNRHVVDAAQNRNLVPFPDSQRIANPPSARYFTITHASGATITIDPTGDVSITAAGSNESAVTMTAAGTITVNAASAVDLGAFGAAVYRLVDERFVTLFNSHTHPANGAVTSTPMAVGTQTTSTTKAS